VADCKLDLQSKKEKRGSVVKDKLRVVEGIITAGWGSSNVGKGWAFAVRPALPTALEQSHTPGRRQQHDRYHNYGWINGLNNGPHCICLHYQPPFHDEAAPMNAQIGPGQN
jgi:hypothetical protein